MVDETTDHHLSYWKLHFGTDVLLSSWFMLISCFFFVFVPVDQFIEDNDLSYYDIFYYSSLLSSGVLYLIGSVFFLAISYPDAMEDLMVQAMQQDVSKLTFTEKYFTGNKLLGMTWFFALATLPLAVFYLWATVTGNVSVGYGIVALISVIISFLSLLLWVVACFPENMQKNDGRGSEFFIEFMEENNFFCGNEKFWRNNFTGDFLVGSWVLLVVAAASFPAALYYYVVNPESFRAIVFFLSSLFFLLGAILLVHSSYPGNFSSDWSWRLMTCTLGENHKLFTSHSQDEIIPLTSASQEIDLSKSDADEII